MRRIGVFIISIFLLHVPMAAVAQNSGGMVPSVTEIFADKVTIYTGHDGASVMTEVNRNDVLLPARFFGEESDYGFIQVKFLFKESSREPVLGWVNSGVVDTNEVREADVVTDCSIGAQQDATVTRGTRALGDKC